MKVCEACYLGGEIDPDAGAGTCDLCGASAPVFDIPTGKLAEVFRVSINGHVLPVFGLNSGVSAIDEHHGILPEVRQLNAFGR
jgi:hypothetical protein